MSVTGSTCVAPWQRNRAEKSDGKIGSVTAKDRGIIKETFNAFDVAVKMTRCGKL